MSLRCTASACLTASWHLFAVVSGCPSQLDMGATRFTHAPFNKPNAASWTTQCYGQIVQHPDLLG
eukprot:UN4801